MIENHVRLRIPLVCGNLGPGYDTFGLALAKYNYVEMRTIPAGLTVDIIGSGQDFLPRDTASVVYKAASMLFRKRGFAPPGLSIRLENNIPVGKGLGSFAGAVSAGVFAANLIMGQPFDENHLIKVATGKVGSASNVAASYLGNFVITSKHQEVYSATPFPEHIQPVLVIPDVPSYDPQKVKLGIPRKVSINDANYNVSHAAMLTLALVSRECSSLLKKALTEKIVTSHRQSYFPGLKEIFMFINAIPDSYGISMCNDGPSFVCFLNAESDYERHISKIRKLLSARRIDARVEAISVASRGIERV